LKTGSVSANNTIPTLDTLRKMLNADAISNMIPIVILNYNYNVLKEYAVDSNLVYLSNEQLFDNTSRTENPYNEKQIFMALPGLQSELDSVVTFYIDDKFIYSNTSDSITSIEIDFGDGAGYRTLSVHDTIEINYPDYALKTIKIKVYYGGIYGYSVSYFSTAKWSDDVFDIRDDLSSGKGKYTITYGFDAEGEKHECLKKPFLLVEGIDFGYKEMPTGCKSGKCGSLGWVDISTGIDHVTYPEPGEPSLKAYGHGEFDYTPTFFGILLNDPAYEDFDDYPDSELITEGYDVIYLDFYDSAADMVENSNVVIEMINWINENKCSEADETVIVGASMGGQLCRYALSKMEQDNIDYCSNLYVSFDSPNQGANILLGMQEFINYFSGKSEFAEDAYNRKLKRTASTQLLIYHTDGNESTGRHGNRTIWLENLEDVGIYPQNIRKVAIANGNKIASEQEFDPSELLITADGTSILYAGDLEFGASAFALPGITDNAIFSVDYTFYLGYILPIWWTEEYYAPDYPLNYDNAPGCHRADLEQFSPYAVEWGLLPLITFTDIDHYYDNYSFVPTISALDFNTTNLIYNVNSVLPDFPNPIYPFDAYYAPDASEYHVTINEGNTHWMFEQLQLVEYQLGTTLPTTGLGNTFNFGNKYHKFLHSLNINSGGLLQINGNYATDYGDGDPAITGSTFTVTTSACNITTVNINNGGLLEIGDDNTPTNNKGTLELLDGSKIIVKNGGTLKINKNSKLYIKNGATLEIRSGSAINVEDFGEIIVASGGLLLMKAETLNLLASNSKLSIHNGGTVQTTAGIDFTFTGDGLVFYHHEGIFDIGEGGVFRLTGTGEGDPVLWLQPDAALEIDGNDVEISDAKILYEENSQFVSKNAEVTINGCEFSDYNNDAAKALNCSESHDILIEHTAFTGFNTAVQLEDINTFDGYCEADVNINYCTFTNHRSYAMEAADVARLYGYANTITAANSTIQYGMAAYNCGDFTWTNSTIKNFTTGRGVYLENVTAFVMSGGSIQSNEYGKTRQGFPLTECLQGHFGLKGRIEFSTCLFHNFTCLKLLKFST